MFYSTASVWEIAFKVGVGKWDEARPLLAALGAEGALADDGFTLLDIKSAHAVSAGLLAIPHKDPFDRMLIAQAQSEGLTLVSNEQLFDAFGVTRL